MDKEDTVHIDNGILHSHQNKPGSFTEAWMDLDTIMQNEINQNEKGKYCR